MKSNMGDIKTLVFDHGSAVCKAGFAGEECPRAFYTTRCNESNQHFIQMRDNHCCPHVDQTTSVHSDMVDSVQLTKHSNTMDWDTMEKLWHHTFFNELRVSPEEHAVLLTESYQTSNAAKEMTAEIMFETFCVPGIHMINEAILSLYITGRTSGVVLEVGEASTRCIPIDDGEVLKEACNVIDFAGKDLTDILQRMIWSKTGRYVTSETCRDIKETLCFVAQNFELELAQYNQNPYQEKLYKLPDGGLVTLTKETFSCPEYLFTCPITTGEFELKGLQQLINTTIRQCDVDLLGLMYRNIVLSGGTCSLPGISERIRTEVARLTPYRTVTITGSPTHQKNMVWVGGSMLAAIPSFQESLTLKDRYEEIGCNVVVR